MKVYKPVGAGPMGFDNVKPAFVADNLGDLEGPQQGTVELPLYLDWTPGNSYDLSQPTRVRTLYATVLREARSEQDLKIYLSSHILAREWLSLRIPAFLREEWETRHPELTQCSPAFISR